MDLHGTALQLQQASPHVHLLLQSADELLPQLSHLSLLTLSAVQLDFGCPEDGGWRMSVEEGGQAKKVRGHMEPSPPFPNHFLSTSSRKT